MRPRGYHDLGRRMRKWPGRLWCDVFHQRLWKVWRRIDTRHGPHAVLFFCRVCGRQVMRRR